MQPVLTCTIAPSVNLLIDLSLYALSPPTEQALDTIGQRLLAATSLFKGELQCWMIYDYHKGLDFRPLGIERFIRPSDLVSYLQVSLATVSQVFAEQVQAGTAGVRIERSKAVTEAHDRVDFLIWWDDSRHPASLAALLSAQHET